MTLTPRGIRVRTTARATTHTLLALLIFGAPVWAAYLIPNGA